MAFAFLKNFCWKTVCGYRCLWVQGDCSQLVDAGESGGLVARKMSQQKASAQGGDCPPLLGSCEASSAVLCPGHRALVSGAEGH